MAHVHTYGEQAKNARKIIHLGATSAYVGDNTDLIQIKEGLLVIRKRLLVLIEKMRDFALQYKDLPTLGLHSLLLLEKERLCGFIRYFLILKNWNLD